MRDSIVPAGGIATGGVLTFSASRDRLDGLAREKREMIPGRLCIKYEDIHGRQFVAVSEMRAYPAKNRLVAGDCSVRIADESPSPGGSSGYALDLREKSRNEIADSSA